MNPALQQSKELPMAEKTVDFEQSLERLETIVDEMESGDLPLEAMIRHFEEGSRLVALCSRKLTEAEQKIEKLVKKGDGLGTEPFTPEDQGSADAS
jgi:exodeoxyribonuclease VII small subunit